MHYNFDEPIQREGTGSVKYDLRKAVFGNEEVIPVWVADMDFKTPDFIIQALQKRLEHEILGYTFRTASFYESIINWNQRRHGWKIQRDWISFAPGVVPSLNMLVEALTEPGDSIMVQPPVYFPFFSAVENHSRKLLLNPLRVVDGKYRMDFDDLEAKIESRTRMLILCNPHNPVGIAWPPDVLRRLGSICLKHNIVILSDEIHYDLVFSGYKHTPMAGLSDDINSLTVTCMAPSKTFNLAGLSTSYVVISDRQMRLKYEKELDRIHVGNGNIFGNIALEAAYNHGDEWLSQLMNYLDGNLRLLQTFMAEKIPAIKVIPPEATYLVWLDCRELGMEPEALRQFIIHEAGLGMNDGLQFGEGGAGFQRINIACPRYLLLQALGKLHAAISKYFNK
jgi:cysteine-S-conjugate beta-lyase